MLIPRVSRERLILVMILTAHFTLLLVMGLVRHWNNMTALNDAGVFDQAIWGTLHGKWFLNTNNCFGVQANWLGFHFNPILVAFVPLYAFWPAVEWLAVVQAFALSIGSWPVFLLASRVHGSERMGVAWTLAYLFNPYMMSAAAWDFHPVTLAVPFIAAGLLAVEMKNFRLLLVCCLMLMLVQEQFGITVAGFGGLWAIRYKHWKGGALLTLIGLLHAVLTLGVIMPALSPSGSHPFISSGAQFTRYNWLGSSLQEIASNIFLHPMKLLATFTKMPNEISYILELSLPFLGLFLLAPLWLLPGIADLAANMLSSFLMPRGIMSYHSVTLVPVLTVASIYGVHRLAPQLARHASMRVTCYVLCSTFVLGYFYSPLPLPGGTNFWAPAHVRSSPDPALSKVRRAVGDQTSVSAQANIAAHFSQRRQVYSFPQKVGKTDSIVLWLDTPTNNIFPQHPSVIGTTGHHLQMIPAKYLATVECVLRDRNYRVALWEDPWLVLSRDTRTSRDAKANDPEVQSIREKLRKLSEAWHITAKEYTAAIRTCEYRR